MSSRLERIERGLFRTLEKKNRHCWGQRFPKPVIEKWLENFGQQVLGEEEDRILALFILSRFVFLSRDEIDYICELLLVQYLRYIANTCLSKRCLTTSDVRWILSETRFHGLGRPSESGDHILYFFRQANDLPKSAFFDPKGAEVEEGRRDSERSAMVHDFKFLCVLDDVTLSGNQAMNYADATAYIDVDERVFQFLVGTNRALGRLRGAGISAFSGIHLQKDELSLGPASPAISDLQGDLKEAFSPADVRKFVRVYGRQAWKPAPLGYGECALLLGFPYNVPDNTLPIFWSSDGWVPIKERDHKLTGGTPEIERPFI